MREKNRGMSWWVAGILVAILVAIFALSLSLAPDAAEGDESFPGTDSVATELLKKRGVEPWFTPIFEPGSGEIESGLFALQAALGAGLFGYALGNLQGRSKARREQAEATPSASTEPLSAQ